VTAPAAISGKEYEIQSRITRNKTIPNMNSEQASFGHEIPDFDGIICHVIFFPCNEILSYQPSEERALVRGTPTINVKK